jgi:hypothetical protein
LSSSPYLFFLPHFKDFLLDTLSSVDAKHSTRRSTAQVYILKTSKTTAEIRRTKAIGKEEEEEHKDDLYETFLESIRNDEELGPKVEKNGELWVAGLVLDSHWDSLSKQLTGHAALGGSDDSGINLGMFGSHLVHSWPSCLEEVVPCFMDETPIDESRLANDSKVWEKDQEDKKPSLIHLLSCLTDSCCII